MRPQFSCDHGANLTVRSVYVQRERTGIAATRPAGVSRAVHASGAVLESDHFLFVRSCRRLVGRGLSSDATGPGVGSDC